MASEKIGTSVEIWKLASGVDPYYEVSNWGRVRSIKRVHKTKHYPKGRHYKGKILTPWTHQNGYKLVDLLQDGRRKHKRIHRLVVETFHGSPPTPKHEPNHKDSDRANNNASNLEWCTRSENLKHGYAHGFKRAYPKYGEENHLAKLKEDAVLRIRRLDKQGVSRITIAKQFDICYSNVWQICTRRSWKHLD